MQIWKKSFRVSNLESILEMKRYDTPASMALRIFAGLQMECLRENTLNYVQNIMMAEQFIRQISHLNRCKTSFRGALSKKKRKKGGVNGGYLLFSSFNETVL